MNMKKLLKYTFIAALVAVAGYGSYTSLKTETISDLLLANVEALAEYEGGSSDCETYCTPDTRCTCIITFVGETQGITCDNCRGK